MPAARILAQVRLLIPSSAIIWAGFSHRSGPVVFFAVVAPPPSGFPDHSLHGDCAADIATLGLSALRGAAAARVAVRAGALAPRRGFPFLGKGDVRSPGWHAFPLVARVMR